MYRDWSARGASGDRPGRETRYRLFHHKPACSLCVFPTRIVRPLIDLRGLSEKVHIFRRFGFTKALLCIPVMSPLHRSELLVCNQCG